MSYFGVMLDCSRNAVMKVEEIKNFAKILHDFGYNMIQLYTEDTYEIEEEPYFGYMRGRYTKQELKEVVEYCETLGMEVVPCIQTLAHLKQIFRWTGYQAIHDYEDILLVGEERTYQLIENMFKSIRESFSSNYVHIGMDEAFMLGLGKYRSKHGIENTFDILHKHLLKVVDIANKYGFTPIMWSDMFFRLANDGNYYPKNPQWTSEAISKIPKQIELMYWDYYHTEEKYYERMMSLHQQVSNAWFAGSAWSFSGFAPGNRKSIDTMLPAMKAAKSTKTKNILITMWGDDGKECSFYSVLPSLFAIRKFYEGEYDTDTIKFEFEKITGEKYDSFMELDKLDMVGGSSGAPSNPAKHMLYNDPFCGIYDTTAKANVSIEYAEIAQKLKDYAKTSKFSYLFQTLSNLADVLTIKYDLGVRTRKAYQDGDREALSKIICDYEETAKRLQKFHQSFQELWLKENKANGFEVQDIRIGGLIQRIKSCQNRLKLYINNEIDRIPELEEELLDFYGNGREFNKGTPGYARWKDIVSVNVLVFGR